MSLFGQARSTHDLMVLQREKVDSHMHTNIKMPNFYSLVEAIYSWLSIMKKIK